MSDPFIQILAVYKETKAVDLNVTKLIMAKRSLNWLTRGAMPQAALAHLSVALDVFLSSQKLNMGVPVSLMISLAWIESVRKGFFFVCTRACLMALSLPY